MLKAGDWHKRLFNPVDSFSLDLFRTCFGILLLYQVYYYHSVDLINTGYLVPRVLFPFDFLPFIHLLPAGIMKLILPLMFVSAVLIIFNKLTRIAFSVYFLCFTYLFLLEKSYYNNHLYLFCLLLFLFLFYKPVKNTADGKSYIPYWLIFLMRFQVFLVYFVGGIVKLNSDWIIHHQPVKLLLAQVSGGPPSEALIYYFVYGGVAYDLLIGFLLWNKKTFKAAFILTVIFNLSNMFLFNFNSGGEIGVFPVFMICANLLFTDGAELRKMVQKFFPASASKKQMQHRKKETVKQSLAEAISFKKNSLNYFFIYTYLVIQVTLPFRHFFYSGNVDWTSRGQFFAWRMKSCSKQGKITFRVKDMSTGTVSEVNPGNFINTMQVNYMAYYPDMFLTFATFLQREAAQKFHVNNVEVYVDAKVSFNGREEQYLIDPNVNLLALKHSMVQPDEWILPLKAGFPAH